mmetsp:Transcript_2685/g.3915  ORF Transcript_2685/g.3915 Transcript_2685/m.3915 type:complete len:221 (-) Transcript_2685:1455-2117(-)
MMLRITRSWTTLLLYLNLVASFTIRNNGTILRNRRGRQSLHAALGELSTPPPPRLDDDLLKAAKTRLPWESAVQEHTAEEQPSSWENGELWFESRPTLVKLWVLPRDMSNGADAKFAAAATKGERDLLSKVPQLLRLPTLQIIESAKTVKEGLGPHQRLPPALLRSEPMLLAFPPLYIRGGLGYLSRTYGAESALKQSRDTPGALVKAIEDWMEENATIL